MPAMFIAGEVDPKVVADVEAAKQLVEVCPVGIFAQDDSDRLAIVDDNLDECTLCDLCIDAAPAGTVKVVKLYE